MNSPFCITNFPKLLCVSFSLIFYLNIFAIDIFDFNQEWRINKGFESSFKTKKGQKIDLPHTWNTKDAMFGDLDYHRGMYCYSKNLSVPKDFGDKRLFLKVNSAQTVADVYVDKKFVGQHKGGYTAFVFELTDYIEPGKNHELDIRVTNAQTMEIAPICGDFNTYGGLYRGVELLVADDRCISPDFYASSGVFVTQSDVTDKNAIIDVRVLLSGKKRTLDGCRVEIRLKDGDKTVAKALQNLCAADRDANVSLSLKNPRLWDGLYDPHLYTIEASLCDENDRTIDSRKEQIGLRYFSVDPDKGFFLNGHPYRLRGANMHQDRAERASAYINKDFDQDLDIVQEMGCNAMRLAHYPHAKYLHNQMDSRGLVAWSEIPFVNVYVDNPAYKENLRQQLRELIYQNYNHPSILFWGLFNEINRGWMDDPNPMTAELVALAKEIDPQRLVTGASNQDDKFNGYTDMIASNRYFGWARGEIAEMGEWLDKEHAAHPKRSLGISEFGAGASVTQQSDSLVRPEPYGQWHPENWQTYYHIENYRQLKSRPWLWCNFIWCMFDFGAAPRREGNTFGRNDKGLVTYDRSTRKDAFYFYKANWNENEKFLYIASKRNNRRNVSEIDLQVFSNCGGAELYVNGKNLGFRTPDEVNVISWDNIKLNLGENHIEVKNKKASDSVSIYHQTPIF